MHTLGAVNLDSSTMERPPILLSDDQMQRFVTDGYLTLQPSVPDGLHDLIDEKFDWIVEHEPNPGNNILPRLPELNYVLQSPEVRGAMISLLGEDYLIHPHKYWHYRKPDEDCPNDPDEVWKRVQAGSHQDSYSPSSQPKCHYLRYARFMYYSHDVEELHGPTHVIPGSQYHGSLVDEDRAREVPVTGPAGTVFLSHFEMGHSAGVNLSDRVRHMIKFIFMRTEEPTAPSWSGGTTTWRTPDDITAPHDLETAWRHQWDWLRGADSSGQVHKENTLTVPELIGRLNTADQAERTKAIYNLADRGSEPLATLTKILEASGHRESLEDEPDFHKRSTVTMDDAAYALIAIGADAVTPLLSLLDAPYEWTRMNAIFALGEIGPPSQWAVARLIQLLDDPSHRIIRYAAIALGTIGDSDAQGPLCDLLAADADGWDELIDNNWPVRFLVHVNAAMALAKMGKQASDSEATLIHHLNHPCGHVGMFLTEALKRIGTSTAKEALLKDLEFRRWDSSLHEQRQF